FNTPGISSVNLRGLGDNRNLVLIDGRRGQPANATLVVDVNSIPAAAIESVEIISGGASATYGADAIAGVVNFKLKNNFQGVSLDAQTSITQEGDGAETRISALIGGNFGDGRGNAMVGLELARREAVLQRDRQFYVEGWEDPNTTGGSVTSLAYWTPPGGGFPSQAAVDQVFGRTGISRTTGFYFNTDGTLFKQNPLVGFNSNLPNSKVVNNVVAGNTVLSLSEPERNGQISSPLDRYSLFARATFDINENVRAFVQGNMSAFEVDQILSYPPATTFWGVNIPRDADHPVPEELAILLDSRPDPNAPWLFENFLDFVGPRSSHNETTVYQVMAGLEGNLGLGDWTYEVYGSHGETKTLNYLNSGFVSYTRYAAVLQAPNYGQGLSISDPSNTLGYNLTCTTGLPVFEPFTPSQDCLDAIDAKMKNITSFKQDIMEANFQGALADMPAGELRAAAGLSYRKNTVDFEPDILNNRESVFDYPVGIFAANGAGGTLKATEAYGELLVPLIAGKTAVKDLSLELGGRFSDYSTGESLWTYKALVNWKLNDFVSFRGGYQKANRAANTAELYAGVTTVVAGFPLSDPCAINTRAPWGNVPGNPNRTQVIALCSALIGSGTSPFDADPLSFPGGNGGFFPLELEQRRGNTDLKSESAATWTAGVVLRSPFENPAASGMSLTVDWYDITLDNAISPLPGTTVYENCFNVDGQSNPSYDVNNEYCQMIFRDPITGGRATTDAPYSNLGTIKTSGIDMSYTWRAALADLGLESAPGTLMLNMAGTYLLKYDAQAIPGGPFLENKGTLARGGQFDWTLNTNIVYQLDNWSLRLGWRHLPSVLNGSRVTTPTSPLLGAGAYDIFNLTGNWTVNGALSLRAGIENLFDTDPEIIGRDPGVNEARGSTNTQYYDVLGRRFFVGVRLTF
ncbi:MAG: TonB-dependent receptor, partial [Nevskiaceae bacterium]|nr:TonB-dependent receptor [Nevskiaceae bacterium]